MYDGEMFEQGVKMGLRGILAIQRGYCVGMVGSKLKRLGGVGGR